MRSVIPIFPPPRSRRTFAFCAALAATCLSSHHASATEIDAKLVVDTNTEIPGGPFEAESSTTFTTLFAGSTAGGQLVFNGLAQDEFGVILGQGVYAVDVGGDEPQIIADTRTCADAPCGQPPDLFSSFETDLSFDGSTVGFRARLNGFSGSAGVWTSTGTTLTLAVEEGDPNPSGGVFDTFASPAVDGGEVAFAERSFGVGVERGIFAAPTSGGSARVLADDSTAAPGAGGALFDPANLAASMNNVAYRDGLLVFRGVLDNGDQGLYVEDDVGLRVVVDSSTLAPGLDGATFTNIFSFLTDDGDIVFLGGGPNLSTGRGFYAERDGTLLPTPIMLARTIDGSVDPCDQSKLLFIDSSALGDGSFAFVSQGALYSARIGTDGLSRLLVAGDTIDGKTIGFLGGGTLHPEAISDGSVFPLLKFTDDSMGIYCLGIPETSQQCSPAAVPVRCLSVPEPAASVQLIVAMASLAVLRRRGRKWISSG